MKPFVLLATRAEDPAADGEYGSFLRYGGLKPEELLRIRLEQSPMPRLDLDDFSGVIVGGSPFDASLAPDRKTAVQRRVEADMARLLDEIVARDFPFFGACYGVGTLGVHQGAVIDATFAEPVGAITIRLTEAGLKDALLESIPASFDAFVGHKEACRVLPESATLLASSDTCPVQMFRVKQNLYATQFHPELDAESIATRIRVYRHNGYFEPDEAERIIAELAGADVEASTRVLRAFVSRYARP
jgi:GMP synthase (glutamine-hydrolysing)